MDWAERLSLLLSERNYAAVARKLGFTKNRLYTIVKERSCPNAIDAVKLCRYLGTTVEAIFGDEPGAILKSPTREEAGERALAETGAEREQEKKSKGRGRRKRTG